MRLEPPLDDFARELVVTVREADVELAAQLHESALHFAVPVGQQTALVLEHTHALLAARELFLHLTDSVLQQHVWLFDAIEHGVHVRREESRHSVDQCHGITSS